MKPKDQPPPAAEHAKLRAYLALKGVSASDITGVVGNAPSVSRHELAARITQWLKTRTP